MDYSTSICLKIGRIKTLRKPMTTSDLRQLLIFIEKYHKFGRGKSIKYVTPHIDMRYGDIHAIEFRGFHDRVFSITNENKDKDLYLWIMEWLNE